MKLMPDFVMFSIFIMQAAFYRWSVNQSLIKHSRFGMSVREHLSTRLAFNEKYGSMFNLIATRESIPFQEDLVGHSAFHSVQTASFIGVAIPVFQEYALILEQAKTVKGGEESDEW